MRSWRASRASLSAQRRRPAPDLFHEPLTQDTSRIQTAIGAALLAASLISPMARASSAETAGTAAVGEVSAVKQAFHYTFSRFLPDIEEFGLRPGTYATTDGTLSPLQAQIDLALQPNIGVRDTLISIDLTALQDAGYHLPEITQVPVGYGMPGGGTQMQFPYRIPPTFLTVVRRW